MFQNSFLESTFKATQLIHAAASDKVRGASEYLRIKIGVSGIWPTKFKCDDFRDCSCQLQIVALECRLQNSHVVGRTIDNQDRESNEGNSTSPATSTEIGPIVYRPH